MSKKYLPPKSSRLAKDSPLEERCTSERYFVRSLISEEEKEGSNSITLKKATSCTSLKDGFVSSLITRMRGVPRPLQGRNKIKQVNVKLLQANLKLQKSKQKLESYKQSVHDLPKSKRQENFNGQQGDSTSTEVYEFRVKVAELMMTNKQLEEKNKELQCQLFYQRQAVEQLMSEIQCRDKLIAGLQHVLKISDSLISENRWQLSQSLPHSGNQQQSIRQADKKKQIKYNQKQKQNSSHFFKIERAYEHSIMGILSLQKLAILKANNQIASLKKQLFSLESTYGSNYADLLRRKNDEIDLLRKNFSSNLKYYKKMIIKCTTKSRDDNLKQSEQIMQSTLLQSSSIIQMQSSHHL